MFIGIIPIFFRSSDELSYLERNSGTGAKQQKEPIEPPEHVELRKKMLLEAVAQRKRQLEECLCNLLLIKFLYFSILCNLPSIFPSSSRFQPLRGFGPKGMLSET